jgi:gliding motility-associated lipoprotein GldH
MIKMNWQRLLNKCKGNLYLFIFFGYALLCMACHSDLKISKEFENNRWKNLDYIKGQFEIEEVADKYQLKVKIHHTYQIQLHQIPLQLILISPNKELITIETMIDIKNTDNTFLGDCLGDLCDYETTIPKELKFPQAGLYDVAILHLSDQATIQNIQGIEVSLVKKEE